MICERLEAAGLDTFIDDRDIAGGDDIPLMIQAEMRGTGGPAHAAVRWTRVGYAGGWDGADPAVSHQRLALSCDSRWNSRDAQGEESV